VRAWNLKEFEGLGLFGDMSVVLVALVALVALEVQRVVVAVVLRHRMAQLLDDGAEVGSLVVKKVVVGMVALSITFSF
jgi:hypothetical protein